MFHIDLFGNLQPTSIYVVRPSGQVLGNIDEIINETTASLSVGLNQQYTFEAEVNKIDGKTDWYEYLQEGMYLFLENIGLFKMYQNPVLLDGVKETKTVTAYSIDSELEDKTIQFGVNLGKKDESMEYLVKYDDDETEALINPYTGIPYDWIVLYNTFHIQLHELDEKVRSGHFGTNYVDGELVVTDPDAIAELTVYFDTIPRLKSKVVFTDNPDGSQDSTLIEYVIIERDPNDEETIVSYTLTRQFRSRIEELIAFYIKYRKQLSLIDLVLDTTDGNWSVGTIYGISNGDYSLANKRFQFDIDETIYSFFTQTLANSIECVVNFDILNRRVNVTPVSEIGYDTGIVIGYETLVNTLNIATEDDRLATRLYVTGGDNLDISRVNFGSNYIEDLSYKMNVRDSYGNRLYVDDSLAEKYEQYCEYREEQRAQYIEDSILYEKYNEKVSEIENRVPNDGLKVEYDNFTANELKGLLTTYKNLLATLTSLYKEDYGEAGLNPDGSINENYIKNTEYWYDYQAYQSIIDEINFHIVNGKSSTWDSTKSDAYEAIITAWETDWTLYGTIELQNKIKTYQQNMDLLAEESVIRVSDTGYAIKTWTGTGAGALTDTERALYGNDSTKYRYDLYMDYYNNMVSAQTYLDTLQSEVNNYKNLRDATVTEREQIVNNVAMSTYFTADECKTLNRLLRDSDYSNENILTTSIDTIEEKIEHMKELLEDGKEQVSITSRPQITFTTELNNMLALTEFKPFWSSFLPGNYVYVQYKDDSYVKLRLIGYQYNPCLPTAPDFSVTFSNFTRSRSYYHDWGYLLGNSSGVSGGRGGSSSSGGSGEFGGSDDIDVTISNTMLSKLLNTELFGTRVTDVILDTLQANVIAARSARFNNLAVVATTGSYNDLSQKPNLEIYVTQHGEIQEVGNIDSGQGTGFKVDTDGLLTAANAVIWGTIYASAGTIGGWILNGNMMYSSSNAPAADNIFMMPSGTTSSYTIAGQASTGWVFTSGNTFGVTKTGGVYATSGKIGGMTITASSIYSGTSAMSGTGSTTAGVYLGTDGLRIYKDATHYVSVAAADGIINAVGANIKGSVTASYLTALNYVYIHDTANTARIALTSNTTDTPSLDIASGFSAIRLLKPTSVAGTISATGAISGGSLSVTGAISGASVSTTGNISSSGGSGSFKTACYAEGANGKLSVYSSPSGYNGLYDSNNNHWILYENQIQNMDSGKRAGDVTFYNGVWASSFNATGNASIYANKGGFCVLLNTNGHFRPLDDEVSACGTGQGKWTAVYAKNGTIQTSDRKDKEEIADISFAKDLIMSLKPVSFKWKNGDHRRKRMGFIAQDTSEICNNLNENLALVTASYKGDESKEYFGENIDDELLTWGMNKDELIAPIVKVAQELNAEIQQLKQQLKELKEKQ